MNDKIVKLLNVREVLQRELGRRPTPRELAKRSELPLETVELAFESAQAAVSLDQSIGKEDSGTFYDITADAAAQSAEDARFAAELAALVGTLLDQLPDREELILRLRHGVGGTEPMTLEQIAQVIGVSRERVRQLEARAVSLLRAQVASNAAYLGERDDTPEADPRQPEA